MSRIEFFYPSFTKKAVTFTIDDGNKKYDTIFLDILRPAGIKGTFNLCSNISSPSMREELKEFYCGYGIANHCKYHPLVNLDGIEYRIAKERFDEATADPAFIYPVEEAKGFYWAIQPNGWRQMVLEEDYLRFVDEGQRELREIFGEGAARDYVWPYREMENERIRAYVKGKYRSVRKTGCTYDLDGFAIPRDKKSWSYNAVDTNLLEVMEKYENYPDDGELKFFAFGVHSYDFERDGRWDDLREFARRYGNRPDTYWYASVEDIFDYEEAVRSVNIKEGMIENPGPLMVYLTVDGDRITISPGKRITI